MESAPRLIIAFSARSPSGLPAWVTMWLLAIAIYALLKMISWLGARGWRASAGRSLAYLLAWPGMDGPAFLFDQRRPETPSRREVAFAAAKCGLGLGLLAVALRGPSDSVWLRGWLTLVALAMVLHFGVFHLLSCLWRGIGWQAMPIMHWPILATSVTNFWSRHWNLAFRDLTHRFVFRPLAKRWGAAAALWIGFFLSGVIHDVVISVPAGGGWGLPTLYFLLQAVGLWCERTRWAKRCGLGGGLRGWLFTMAVVALPAPLLFHPPFLRNVVLPMLQFLRFTLGIH